MRQIQPVDHIFAILRAVPEEGLSFAGTAFLVDSRGTFVTARHLVPQTGNLVAAMVSGQGGNFVQIDPDSLVLDDDHDLVAGRLARGPASPGLVVSSELPTSSEGLLTMEFSRTQTVRDRLPHEVRLSPVTRKGHVLQFTESSLFTRRPTQIMELSFPALLGASGAPVISHSSFAVVGMIVGNVDHQIMPAQIERVEYPDKDPVETIRYVVPGAVAIVGSYIADLIGRTAR